MSLPWVFRATVTRVIDGDTVDVDIDLGFHLRLIERLRLARIDAPEKRNPTKAAGDAATAFLRARIDGQPVHVQTEKKGKYGRYLAEIIDPETGENLNDWMVTNGHAVYRTY